HRGGEQRTRSTRSRHRTERWSPPASSSRVASSGGCPSRRTGTPTSRRSRYRGFSEPFLASDARDAPDFRGTTTLEDEHANGPLRNPDPRKRIWRKADRLVHGESGTSDRRRRTTLDRRLVPECELPTEQERDLEREGRGARPPRGGFRDTDGTGRDRHAP